MFCPRTSFALGLDWTPNCRSIHANNTFKRVLRPHFCFKSPALHSLPGVTSTRTNNESNDRIWARYDFWLITWNWETFILWLLTPPPPSVNPSVHPSSKLLLWQARRVVWTLNNSADVSAKDPRPRCKWHWRRPPAHVADLQLQLPLYSTQHTNKS